MLVAGRRFVPWLLGRISMTGSRELFTLSVLAVALGIAFVAAELFGASFALGAFFAGMVLAGSELSHDAAEQSLPLRDAFAVLFFVSVGMLFEPAILLTQPLAVLGVVLVIVVGKSLAALLIVRAFGYGMAAALTISVSLAQIGEFSFILAAMSVELGVLTAEGQDLILAGAIVSILLNPLLFALLDRLESRLADRAKAQDDVRVTEVALDLEGHVILVGYGRVGRQAAKRLAAEHLPFVVVDRNQERVDAVRATGYRSILGPADQSRVLSAAGVRQARAILVAIPNGFEAGRIVALARELNPTIEVIARAHFDAERDHLVEHGAQTVLLAEQELADRMVSLVNPESCLRSAGAAGSRCLADRIEIPLEIGPDQGCDEHRKAPLGDEPGQPLRVGRQLQRLGRLECPLVGEGVELGPSRLRLAAEDGDTDLAHALELLQQTPLLVRLAVRRFPQPAQIAAVELDETGRALAEHRRGPLVVACIARPVEDVGPLLPVRLGHLLGRGPACLGQCFRGLDRDLAADPRAEEERGGEPAEQGRGSARRDVDADLLTERPAMPFEEQVDAALGSGAHRFGSSKTPCRLCQSSMLSTG